MACPAIGNVDVLDRIFCSPFERYSFSADICAAVDRGTPDAK
jgi:hypothetical protein